MFMSVKKHTCCLLMRIICEIATLNFHKSWQFSVYCLCYFALESVRLDLLEPSGFHCILI